jgi:hypothetical protein
MIYEFDGFRPVIHESSFIHPNATVTGNVTIGRDVYVGPGAAIRGDWGAVVVEDGCNVQENCAIHMPGGRHVPRPADPIGEAWAVIPGERRDGRRLDGAESVGALTFVPAQCRFRRARWWLAVRPDRKRRERRMIDWKTQGTRLYQRFPRNCIRRSGRVNPYAKFGRSRSAAVELSDLARDERIMTAISTSSRPLVGTADSTPRRLELCARRMGRGWRRQGYFTP